jgi:hypothetical protein
MNVATCDDTIGGCSSSALALAIQCSLELASFAASFGARSSLNSSSRTNERGYHIIHLVRFSTSSLRYLPSVVCT